MCVHRKSTSDFSIKLKTFFSIYEKKKRNLGTAWWLLEGVGLLYSPCLSPFCFLFRPALFLFFLRRRVSQFPPQPYIDIHTCIYYYPNIYCMQFFLYMQPEAAIHFYGFMMILSRLINAPRIFKQDAIPIQSRRFSFPPPPLYLFLKLLF